MEASNGRSFQTPRGQSCRAVLCGALAPQQAFDLLPECPCLPKPLRAPALVQNLRGPEGLCHAEKLVSSYRAGSTGAPGYKGGRLWEARAFVREESSLGMFAAEEGP